MSVESTALQPQGRDAWLIVQADHWWIRTRDQAPFSLAADDAATASQRMQWWLQSQPVALKDWAVIGASDAIKNRLSAVLPPSTQWGTREWLVPADDDKASLVPALALKKLLGKSVSTLAADQVKKRFYALAGTLLASWIIGLNAYAYVQNKQLQSTEAVIEKAFADTLPNTPMIADPLVLLERAKADALKGSSLKDKDSFTLLLHQAGLAMASLPLSVVENIAWSNKRLMLTLNTEPDAATKTAVESALKAQGITGRWALDTKKHATLTLSTGSAQ